MFINCDSVFRELSEDLPSEGDVFDCNAANRIIEAMDRALFSILTLQRDALELELNDLVGEVGRTKLMQEIEQTNAVFTKLSRHNGRFHNFFLLPHRGEPLHDLTIVRKDTLCELEYTLFELRDRSIELRDRSSQLSDDFMHRVWDILHQTMSNNADLNGRRRR